jgi:hypothetical protein
MNKRQNSNMEPWQEFIIEIIVPQTSGATKHLSWKGVDSKGNVVIRHPYSDDIIIDRATAEELRDHCNYAMQKLMALFD